MLPSVAASERGVIGASVRASRDVGRDGVSKDNVHAPTSAIAETMHAAETA